MLEGEQTEQIVVEGFGEDVAQFWDPDADDRCEADIITHRT